MVVSVQSFNPSIKQILSLNVAKQLVSSSYRSPLMSNELVIIIACINIIIIISFPLGNHEIEKSEMQASFSSFSELICSLSDEHNFRSMSYQVEEAN